MLHLVWYICNYALKPKELIIFVWNVNFFRQKIKEKLNYIVLHQKNLKYSQYTSIISIYLYCVFCVGRVLHIKNNENIKWFSIFVWYFNFFYTKNKGNISFHDMKTNKKFQHYSVSSHRGNKSPHKQKLCNHKLKSTKNWSILVRIE